MKFENTQIGGMSPSIRGMRNALNSHNKSDSGTGCQFLLGQNDKTLAKNLIKEWSVDFMEWLKNLPYSEFITD